MRFIYDIALRSYALGIRLAAIRSEKAKRWLQGRKNLFAELQAAMLQRGQRPLVWMHTASLGEFEQGRPLLEALKKEQPNIFLLLTFFSPSGYEIRKNYALADYVCYLPLDTAENADRFLKITQPDLALFIKYELWYHLLKSMQQKQVPHLLISALFREDQFYFKWYGAWFQPVIKDIDHIFVQDEASQQVLQQRGIERVSIAGDSRVDRVAALAGPTAGLSARASDQRIKKELLHQFVKDHLILVAGSTWPQDEAILAPVMRHTEARWKCIIAPHEVKEDRIRSIEATFDGESIRYSDATFDTVGKAEVLIIDNIGLLSSLYHFATVAYIGGGFGQGIHNTLEPIAHGKPVIFGPRYQKFSEAKWLIAHGGGFAINNASSLEQHIGRLEETGYYQKCAAAALQYITENRGATNKIMVYIKKRWPELLSQNGTDS